MQLRNKNFASLTGCISICLLLSQGGVIAQVTNEDFKPSGYLWGLAYIDFFIKSGGDTATWASKADYSVVPKGNSAFSIRRFYLGYNYAISPVFSASALLEGNDLSLDTRGDRVVFIKGLNLKWKNIYKGADVVIGQQPTIAYLGNVDKFWGYRSIEKTMLDQRAVRASSDLGLAVYGRFDSLANFGYNIMVSNGAGTRPEETVEGNYKLYAGDIFGYFFNKHFVIDLYGELQQDLSHKNFVAVRAFIGYQSTIVTIGFEAYVQSQNNIKPDLTSATPAGFSVFTRTCIVKDKLSVFARYDSYNQDNSFRDQDAATIYNSSTMYLNYDEKFITSGLDYTPHKNVHIMPNIWYNSYTAKAETALLVDREADIVPRVTFYFIFR